MSPYQKYEAAFIHCLTVIYVITEWFNHSFILSPWNGCNPYKKQGSSTTTYAEIYSYYALLSHIPDAALSVFTCLTHN